MVLLDNLGRLIVGAVIEDAVDQLAIVSATFGPIAETHMNESKRKLEDILLKQSEDENSKSGSDIKQLHCESAYIQKVLEHSITEIYKHGEARSLENALAAYKKRLGEKEEIIISEENIKQEIEDLSVELDNLKASEVEMRKKEMRKIAELKVSIHFTALMEDRNRN